MATKPSGNASGIWILATVFAVLCYLLNPGVENTSTSATNATCKRPAYTVRIISHDPLMMHIEDFITLKERNHLLKLGKGLAKRSTVEHPNGTRYVSSTRSSTSAYLPKDDPTAQCVSQRAAEFQGFEPLSNIERLQMTIYGLGQEYKNHFDWYGRKRNVTVDRATTMFATLEADCDHCGTSFPRIPVDWSTEDPKWCRIVDCDSKHLIVNPMPGSAVFWRNLNDDASGDVRTLHAGMPLSRGYKTGLNIWTKQEIPPEV